MYGQRRSRYNIQTRIVKNAIRSDKCFVYFSVDSTISELSVISSKFITHYCLILFIGHTLPYTHDQLHLRFYLLYEIPHYYVYIILFILTFKFIFIFKFLYVFQLVIKSSLLKNQNYLKK